MYLPPVSQVLKNVTGLAYLDYFEKTGKFKSWDFDGKAICPSQPNPSYGQIAKKQALAVLLEHGVRMQFLNMR